MSDDSFGDRMKLLEMAEAGRHLMPLLPIIARLDGRNFSRFTKGLKRPYDERLSNLMVELTRVLVQETNARIGYTQSDEITLMIYSDTFESQVYFDGRIQKMTSSLAATASAQFCIMLPSHIPEKSYATFDCRVWNVPNLTEAANSVLWRELDATKNSVSMAARAYYSHEELHLKNSSEMQDMLHAKGVNWNDFPAFFKRGTYVRRVTKTSVFTPEELASLPPKHTARLNPDAVIERHEISKIDLPPLATVRNREAVLFHGADPETGAPQVRLNTEAAGG